MRHFAFVTVVLLISLGVSCGRAIGQIPESADSAADRIALPESPAAPHTADPVSRSSYLRVENGRFVDVQGRQVLLHGMNVISKSKAENYLSWHGSETLAQMREWGMNCVRLGIIWDGIEPEPGKYDENYLDGVAQRIAWATEHGLYVFLDMHQDLFSVLFSDGAPAWATLHEEQPHKLGAVWSDSYMISPAVQVAFDNFWANSPAPDGVGIQDHYAAAWRHVASRFADNTTLIGYDLMNEPFEGSSVTAGQSALLRTEFATLLAQRLGDKGQSPVEIAALWLDPDGRNAITKQLEDIDVYRAFTAAQQASSQAFERNHLQPMYQRVADAIREVDPHHLLLLETSYHCNAGVTSGIKPVVGANGKRDPLQAYVPHGYDIVVDTADLANASAARVELIFRRHAETAKRLAMPMIIGEWGAFGRADERIVPSAKILQGQLEQLLCGDTYWDYGRDVEKQAYFKTLKRSIPCRIAGTLLEYGTDPQTGTFTCRWKESKLVTAPTVIYLTAAACKDRAPRLEPKGGGLQTQAASEGTGDVYVSIPPTGESVERSLMLE